MTLSIKIEVKIMKRYIIEYPNNFVANFFSIIEFFSFNSLNEINT